MCLYRNTLERELTLRSSWDQLGLPDQMCDRPAVPRRTQPKLSVMSNMYPLAPLPLHLTLGFVSMTSAVMAKQNWELTSDTMDGHWAMLVVSAHSLKLRGRAGC